MVRTGPTFRCILLKIIIIKWELEEEDGEEAHLLVGEEHGTLQLQLLYVSEAGKDGEVGGAPLVVVWEGREMNLLRILDEVPDGDYGVGLGHTVWPAPC